MALLGINERDFRPVECPNAKVGSDAADIERHSRRGKNEEE